MRHSDLGQEDFAANAVRLSPRQWVLAGIVVAAVLVAAPAGWERAEAFSPGADYRLPYELSEDYWLFARWARLARQRGRTLLVGDSVIWGHYAPPDGTLSAHLNRLAGREGFANLGVDGIHPAALAGLIEHHGKAVAGGRVVLHFNPLWLASPAHDLRPAGREARLNHPRLVPQLFTRVGAYRASAAERLAVVVERRLSFANWAGHIRAAYFGGDGLPAWSLDHPYACPIQAVGRGLPAPAPAPRHRAVSWRQRHIEPRDFPWVELEDSLQWRLFRRVVEVLQGRGNRLFVVVGPFNEHLLTGASLAAYTARKRQIRDWLERSGIDHLVPPALASDAYADASHPLSAGYAVLARRLLDEPSFAAFQGGTE